MIGRRLDPNSQATTWTRSGRWSWSPAVASLIISLIAVISSTTQQTSSMELFQVNFIERDGSLLIATSNYNYAISSPKLLEAKKWRTVSMNGDSVLAISSTGDRVASSKAQLESTDLAFIETLRDELANGQGGYTHRSTAMGSGGVGGGNFVSSSTDSSSSSFSQSSSSSMMSSSMGSDGSTRAGEMSYQMRDTNNYSVARSDLPFSWSRVFVNNELITLVYKNGDVIMQPMSSLPADQLEAVNKLKAEMAEMQRTQTTRVANTMQQSMDMVSSVFNNIMGQSFPRPPDFQSSVGNMFGNNFPFGPNNSPFSASSGWPFGGGGGVGGGVGGGGAAAMAFASRR